MQTGRTLENARPVLHAAAFGIIGPEHHPPDAEMHDRRRTHRTRLQRHDQSAVRQARTLQTLSRLPHRQKLGMGGGIMRALDVIARHRQNASVRGQHDRTDRHLATRGRLPRGLERGLHRRTDIRVNPCLSLTHDAMMRRMTPPRPSPSQRAPLIGLTLDHEPGGPGQFSRYPFHALRENYLSAVSTAGGMPVCLGYDCDAEALMARLDGLIVTGGAFDVDPALYDEPPHPLTSPHPARTTAELALLRAALAQGKPVLGICGGMQLLAVHAGGTLIQHLPEELQHEQPNPRHEPGHDIDIVPGTKLAQIVGAERMSVNSSHHQAVRDPGRAKICAYAPDGTIEAIELDGPGFAIGVQWHPEFSLDPGDRRLYAALVETAR